MKRILHEPNNLKTAIIEPKHCFMKLKKQTLTILVLLFCLCPVMTAHARISLGSERLQLSGFGTLGLVKGGNENLGFRQNMEMKGKVDSSLNWTPDSLLGAQLDWQIINKLDATFQLVLKDRVENSFVESIEWAFLKYQATPDLFVRAGRFGADLFMISQYKNVGFAYLWARPPVEFYGPISYNYFNGADLAYSFQLGEGRITTKLLGGVTESKQPLPIGELTLELNPAAAASIEWENDYLQLRLGFVYLELKSSLTHDREIEELAPLTRAEEAGYTRQFAADSEYNAVNVNFYSTGLKYEQNSWIIQTEIGFIDSEFDGFLPAINSYLSIGRNFDTITPYLLFGYIKSTEDPEKAPDLPPELDIVEHLIQPVYDSGFYDQKTLSCGIRWDIRHDTALKAQWDHTWTNNAGASLWTQDGAVDDDDITMDIFSVNISFVF